MYFLWPKFYDEKVAVYSSCAKNRWKGSKKEIALGLQNELNVMMMAYQNECSGFSKVWKKNQVFWKHAKKLVAYGFLIISQILFVKLGEKILWIHLRCRLKRTYYSVWFGTDIKYSVLLLYNLRSVPLISGVGVS